MSNIISDGDLRSILHIQGETRGRDKPQYLADCVFCGKEKHLYINKRTLMFDCKKCGVSGSIYKILKHLDKLYLAGQKTVEVVSKIRSIRQCLEEICEEDENKKNPVVKLPLGFRTAENNPYLLSRGISNEDCRTYNIGITNLKFQYKDYIIFPVMDDGEICGYLARYGNKSVPEGKLRYNNSKNTDFAYLLYGYDEIVRGKTNTVIIVEGVFDKFACDKKLHLMDDDAVKCVATFGKKISREQINKLIRKGVENVVISWDVDALKQIKQYGIELQDFFDVSVAVAFNKKDIDECSEEEVLDIFSNPVDISNFSIGTITKLNK